MQLETICMKYQILFSGINKKNILKKICMKYQILFFEGKNKKNISKCPLLIILPRVFSIKERIIY